MSSSIKEIKKCISYLMQQAQSIPQQLPKSSFHNANVESQVNSSHFHPDPNMHQQFQVSHQNPYVENQANPPFSQPTNFNSCSEAKNS